MKTLGIDIGTTTISAAVLEDGSFSPAKRGQTVPLFRLR